LSLAQSKIIDLGRVIVVAFVTREDGQLITKSDVFQGDLLVTVEDENEESNGQQKKVQHAAMTVQLSDRRINS
jgi:hypothetical protein